MSDKPDHKSTSYSGKKPYLVHNYRTMMKKKTQEEYFFHELGKDPMSELLKPYWFDPEVPGFGWEYIMPDWQIPGFELPGDDGGGVGFGPCVMACNNVILDCAGGCTKIPCICATEPMSAHIAWDDSQGNAYIAGVGGGMVTICVKEEAAGESVGDYPTIGVKVIDGDGDPYVVTVSLVDCDPCCDDISVSGDPTVSPGATWTGTISPACSGATVVVVSNSGCTALGGVVNGAGSEVTVDVAANECGTFVVTVSDPLGGDCSTGEATVRINAEGQGGGWAQETVIWCRIEYGCSSGCGAGSRTHAACVDDSTGFKYGRGTDCASTFVEKCTRPDNSPCASGGLPPCWDFDYALCVQPYMSSCAGCDPACTNVWYDCHRCDWSCVCP